MKMTFRWYGESDPVALTQIRQIPTVSGVVSAVYDVPVGEVWPQEKINALKQTANQNGLAFEVVESVPVHEDIKLGAPKADEYIAAYCENIRRLGAAGVRCICYNFMPVFDWLRSNLAMPHPDGSNGLAYVNKTVLAMNPQKSELSLPGWDESYTKEQLGALLEAYRTVGEEQLWKNLEHFLNRIIPVAEQAGVLMAIHPDDPPWGIFGLPRIITGEENIARFLKLYNSKANGLTFCTGSLGCTPENNLISMIHRFKGRIHFAHLRNVKWDGVRDFHETAHPSACGSLDLFEIVNALVSTGFNGYVRPDHGRMIWGESGRPGYGLYDRALGATYLAGLFEAAEKQNRRNTKCPC